MQHFLECHWWCLFLSSHLIKWVILVSTTSQARWTFLDTVEGCTPNLKPMSSSERSFIISIDILESLELSGRQGKGRANSALNYTAQIFLQWRREWQLTTNWTLTIMWIIINLCNTPISAHRSSGHLQKMKHLFAEYFQSSDADITSAVVVRVLSFSWGLWLCHQSGLQHPSEVQRSDVQH